jgi:S-DNA-T family DNA segregation ATPase FtsK/SpoIIIE
MSEVRRWRIDLLAGGLLLAEMLVALAVFGHEPPIAAEAVPTDHPFGQAGQSLAVALFDTLGLAVYPLLAGWFALVLLLFLRRNVFTWLRRLAGWALAVPVVAVLADGWRANAGGLLGAALTVWLKGVTDTTGQFVVEAAAGLLALLLALDFLLLGSLSWSWLILRGLGRGLATVVGWTFPRKVKPPARKPKASPVPVPPVPVEQPTEPLTSTSAEDSGLIIPIHRPGPAGGEAARAPWQLAAQPAGRYADYELPALDLLEKAEVVDFSAQEPLLRERAGLLEKTFIDFGLKVKVVGIHTGPVITQYEISLETGLRVNKVTALADDLAISLKVPSVRIVAPIPGKNTVGIEVPNEQRAKVRLKEVMLTAQAAAGGKVGRYKLPLFIGKDSEGKPLVHDLAEMPHLLIAGRTGTGKSVCMNSLILSLLMTRRPDEVKFIMIDPKMLELIEYSKIPHLMHPVVKDMKKAEAILSWAVDKMEERYDILSRARVRHIAAYNELGHAEIERRLQPADDEERQRIPDRMPYIVILIDEVADLMMQMKKEVESHIIRLAQKSRAAGIHLVLATQKPIVEVITGLIKSNLPARICFQVSSRTDSRVVLDEMGGDKLLGKGDMLYLQPATSTLVRAQGTFLSDEEIQRVVEFLECEPDYAEELVKLNQAGKHGGNMLEALRERDDMYEQAISVIVQERRGSTSLLQRALGIGYGRAARLIDYMAEDGIVGEYNGSQARDVLWTQEQWDQIKQGGKLAESA